MQKISVSIGIPAYNEEQNIKQLLTALLQQKQESFVLKEIIVVSDGSTDETASEVRTVGDSRVRLLEYDAPKGQSHAQNVVFSQATTDAVVIIEADTLPASRDYLHQLIGTLEDNPTVGVAQGIPRALSSSWSLSEVLCSQANSYIDFSLQQQKSEMFICSGRGGRAFSRRVYRDLRWPESTPEDSYALAWCRSRGIDVAVSSAESLYQVSSSFDHHITQMNKVNSGKLALLKHFTPAEIDRIYCYSRPITVTLRILLFTFRRHPLLTSRFIGLKLALLFLKRGGSFADLSLAASQGRTTDFGMRDANTTVSIGIPAYNEEQNIKQLLTALLQQNQDTFILKEIIVVSDGSTDGTAERVRSVDDPKIRLISLANNRGVGPAQNEIFDRATSDIVVLVDADVLPVGRNFISKLIAPLIAGEEIGLTSADRIAVRPVGVMESWQAFGIDLRSTIFKRLNNGENIYLCFGTARAFRHEFYRQLRWPAMSSEDSYSYLACIESGYRFAFVPAAQVLFRAPATFGDHAKQSNRFRLGRRHLIAHFGYDSVREQFALPYGVVAGVLFRSVLFHPILTIGYVSTTLVGRVYKWLRPVDPDHFEIAASSKKIVV